MDPELRAWWDTYGEAMKRTVKQMEEEEKKKQEDIVAGRCYVCGRPHDYSETSDGR